MDQHGNVVFGGNGYSEEWHRIAVEERGLLNLPTTADALPYLQSEPVKDLFAKIGVLTEKELESRYEVYSEQYILAIDVEAKLVIDMAKTVIYPTALRYLADLSNTIGSLMDLGVELGNEQAQAIASLTQSMMDSVTKLSEAMQQHDFGSTAEHMQHCAKVIRPLMDEVRVSVDALEAEVADDLWPLPTYEEMLFMK